MDWSNDEATGVETGAGRKSMVGSLAPDEVLEIEGAGGVEIEKGGSKAPGIVVGTGGCWIWPESPLFLLLDAAAPIHVKRADR